MVTDAGCGQSVRDIHTGPVAYRFEFNETIPDGIRRIAYEQLDKACDQLNAARSGEIEEAVHDVRKRCKQLRGLVRLVRPALKKSDARQANAAFRDAARQLASLRDAHALLATFDALVAAHVAEIPSDGIWEVRQGLAARAESASGDAAGFDAQIQRARDLLEAGRSRVGSWTLGNKFAYICAGVIKTYKRGRKRLKDSREQPSDSNLHEWRKRVKDFWYHMQILRDAAPSMLSPLADRLHDLSDVLGDDHDLAVLTCQLMSCPNEFGGDGKVNEALAIICSRRADLQRRAFRLGARLYVERPSAFADRIAGYWQVWQELGEELPAGEIATLAPPSDDLDMVSLYP